MSNIQLTPGSLALFKSLADDAGNWSGMPLFDGTPKDKGHLTHLKKAGLVKTQQDEDNLRCHWVIFTDEGKAFAAANNITIWGL